MVGVLRTDRIGGGGGMEVGKEECGEEKERRRRW